MKRFYAYLVAAFALTATACSTDPTEEIPAEPIQTGTVEMTFSASNETRTTLDYENRATMWCEDDKISILDDQGGNNTFTIKETDGITASFQGKVNEGATKFVAVYPYNAAYKWDGTTISGITIPTAQVCTAGTFPEGANITVAVADENYSLAFKNVCAVMKFQVSYAVNNLTFKSKGSVPTAGAVTVTFDQEGLPVVTATEADNDITLTCSGNFQPSTNYFFLGCPTTFTGGIEGLAEGLISKESTSDITVKRSIITDLKVWPTRILNLVPNTKWKEANARFAAYFMGGATGSEEWVNMSDPNGDKTYSVIVPEGKGHTGVIFCRMDPSKTTNDWNTKWNQTQDMLFSDQRDSNTCTILSSTIAWDGAGYWKLDKGYIYLYVPSGSNWASSNARFATYWYDNGEKWVDMQQEGGSANKSGAAIYRCAVQSAYPSAIFCRMNPNTTANNWNNRWNQTGNLTNIKNRYGQVLAFAGTTWDGATATWCSK